MPTSGSSKRKKRKERQRRLSQVPGSNTASNENDSSDNYGLTEAGYSRGKGNICFTDKSLI